MNYFYKKFYIGTFLVLNFAIYTQNNDVLPDTKPEWVTIYVHGTTTKAGLKLLQKFYPELSYGAPGVHHIKEMPKNSLFIEDVKKLVDKDGTRFSLDHFYTFGWSGALSFSERKKAGQELYEGLQNLLDTYKQKYGFYPKIRIMTFSHGGNVALNMVSHLPFFKKEHVYLELLLIACPVQKVTEHLIEHPEIDFVYTIASTRDLLQVVDTYKYEKKRYFPERFFTTDKNNCCQMKVLVNNRGIGHLDLMRSFIFHIPDSLAIADEAFSLKSFATYKEGKTKKEKTVVAIDIEDDKFCFYKGYNLMSCVYGKRKK